MKFSTLVAVVAPLFTIAEAASGFKDSCGGDEIGVFRLCGSEHGGNPINLDVPFSLCANCRKIDGTYQKTRIDLNKCMVNRNGFLYGQQDGGFGGSCGNCIITYAGLSTVECYCKPYYAVPQAGLLGPNGLGNVVDLNDFIGNDNGILRCFDRWGTKA